MAKKSIAKNYLYNLIYQILTLILPIVTTPYVSRVLGAEKIGIYSFTFSIVTYFMLFGQLGVSLYGKREIAYVQDNKEKRKQIFWELMSFRFITLSIAIVIYWIFFATFNQYGNYYKIWVLQIIATAIDITWFLHGLEEFKKTVIRNILVRTISVTLIFVFVKNPDDLYKFILIYSLADLLGNMALWLYLPKYFKGVKVKNIHIFKHFSSIILLFIPQIADQIYNMLDKTMIGYIIENKTEVGYYEQAQKVIRILLTIVSSLGIVMIPRMASTFASGNKEKIIYYLRRSFNFVFFLSFPMMFGIISVSDEFVPIFFGSGYEKVAILIKIISPILVLMGVATVVGNQYLLPTKKQKEYTIAVLVGLISNFILNIIFIKLWNSIGASIATVISQLIVDIIQINYARKFINLRKIFIGARKYLSSSIIMFIICLIIKYFVKDNLISLIVQISVGGLIYVGILFMLKDENIMSVLDKVKRKISKKI